MHLTKLQIQNKVGDIIIIKICKNLGIPKRVMSNVVKHRFSGVSIA